MSRLSSRNYNPGVEEVPPLVVRPPLRQVAPELEEDAAVPTPLRL